jgi:hypothetical protein
MLLEGDIFQIDTDERGRKTQFHLNLQKKLGHYLLQVLVYKKEDGGRAECWRMHLPAIPL